MSEEQSIFGAKAEVYLKFRGGLRELADKLSKGLVHVQFEVEARESEPYDFIGSCEALGFEMWLESVGTKEPNLFLFRMETEHCLEESFNDQMHDLSLWLARFIASIVDVETIVKVAEGKEIRFGD